MAGDTFDEDGLTHARRLLDEVEANLPRVHGSHGVIVGDPQTQRIVRVLRILTDRIEQIQTDRP